jgi:hypothetical protein
LIDQLILDASTTCGPQLVPLFPIGPFTPHSTCPHHEPIQQGSPLCCMICHRSGKDAHPVLLRDPRTDPAPEPKPGPAAIPVGRTKLGTPHETRKQRRQRMFASPDNITY